MKKISIFLGILVAILIVITVVFSCEKQAEKSMRDDKIQKVKSSVIMLNGQCVVLDIVCVQNGDTCIIDGNIYIVDCNDNDKILAQGTYHIVNGGTAWSWGSSTFPSTLGLTQSDLLGLVNDPNFPVNCCGSGGTTPCDPVKFIKDIDGECIVLDMNCCDGEITGTFERVDCTTGQTLEIGIFCATYIGEPDDQMEYNDPTKWDWCGTPADRSNLLEALRNAYLTPCLQ